MRRYQSAILLVVLVLGSIGAFLPVRKQKSVRFYPDYGFTVWQMPGWTLGHDKRNGAVWLDSRMGATRMEGVTRVLLRGGVCSEPTTLGIAEYFESEIQRMEMLYALDHIGVIEERQEIHTDRQTISWIVIELPATVFEPKSRTSDGSVTTKRTLKRVAVYDIRDTDGQRLTAHIFLGGSDRINNQAREILYSVRLVCS